jgi:hypothetical protein
MIAPQGLWNFYHCRSDTERAKELASELLQWSGVQSAPQARIRTLLAAGGTAATRGELANARSYMDEMFRLGQSSPNEPIQFPLPQRS